MKKKMMTGILVTTIFTCSPSVVNAYQGKENPQLNPINTQSIIGSNSMSNSIRLLGSQFPLIQAYGLVILQQPEVQVESMSSLTNHQNFSKENVRVWLDEYNPKLMDLNQDIIRFNQRINGYYEKLFNLAGKVNEDKQTKTDFIRVYSGLQDHVQMIQENMEQTLSELHQFNTSIVNDSEELSKKVEIAIRSLSGINGDIMQLRINIKKIQEEIQTELTKILNRPKEIIKGSINIGKQIFTITDKASQTKTLDFVTVGSLSDELINTSDSQVKGSAAIIQHKQKELSPLIQKLFESQTQVTEITVIEDQVKGFRELIKRQITTLEYLINDWKEFSETMGQIKMDSNTDSIDSKTLQKQLIKIKKISDETSKQTNQFEDFVTNIKVK
ncbi:hypothetical protein IKE_05961 [Bacillus cereus VD196]|uniref:Non-hemolytic enterotoxin lytic component L2 n=1 Tax=Bacillus cereus VD196 TaxID=1053243 RepID=A0A9W5V5W6_BACCE|nr:HBL/NHE enterotoxin family protein [Bacillus cereus]EJR90578.1 hypothetical protein IKG_05938 [Bacillus cereus VD200]EOO60514.1 hypothetical protein IKE_05961 [Bacillus cereus VD196]